MSRATISVLALTLLLAGPVLADGGAHPAVGANAAPDACESCHAEATPEIVRQWESGSHGLMLVKCFVCHGSTGKDFVEHAKPARCAGCHAAQVASVVPARRTKAGAADCFSCHAPHTLAAAQGAANPHGAR